MQSRIVKWGNSLGLRIPISVARKVGLLEGCPVEFQIAEDALIIRRSYQSLEEMLARVTPDNLPGEMDTGEPVGREIW
ncbi:MAG: AbrB/MazE/SpoVT family DNA-binding domain-containing protein [Desulfurispora sp.]|uniref:AbrB/MazE/SpoVT family DNA-binding domain-containing protein n=1 Tax=Desulfurispora sp. TaxID=3014275 RepID=UPI004049CD42